MALSRAPVPVRRDPGKQRVLGMTVGVLAAFLVVIGQLWYLQVLEGARLQELSDKNRIRIRPVAAPRGVLFDRNGLPLVDNRPAFTLSLIPREIDDRARVLSRVSVLLKIPYAELDDALGRVLGDPLMPVRVRRGLTLEEGAKVEEWKLELPGVIVEVDSSGRAATGAATWSARAGSNGCSISICGEPTGGSGSRSTPSDARSA